MKIEFEPTNEFQEVNGAKCRIWLGTYRGAPIKAWVATVSPQTHDQAINDEFAKEFREVKGEHIAHAYDLRLFID